MHIPAGAAGRAEIDAGGRRMRAREAAVRRVGLRREWERVWIGPRGASVREGRGDGLVTGLVDLGGGV
jgi:hypothetical protein